MIGVLENKVALITGAGNGMGKACALAYAREGASVALIDIENDSVTTTAEEISEIGGKALPLQADVSDPMMVDRAVRQSLQAYGQIDILVNCAGMQGPGAPVWEVNPLLWRKTVEINLWGTFLLCHTTIPGMLLRRYGRIINVASGAGVHPMPYFSGYAASKAGVIHFTRTLAEELKQYGITANAIGVRGITRMWKEVLEAGTGGGSTTQTIRQEVEAGMRPIVEENIPVFIFLASDASRHVTGQYLEANSLPSYLIGRESPGSN